VFARRADHQGYRSQKYRRRLEVTYAGYWYTALTIGIGVVALLSGNNVLYLIESLLLSGMIFSGVLSERAISAVNVEILRSPVIAGEPARDRVRITNRRRFPVFCIEVGEWRGRRFERVAFAARIGPRSSVLLPSSAIIADRGLHRWERVAVATRYPFAFARKIRFVEGPGERLVWPGREGGASADRSASSHAAGSRGGDDFAEGEVRPLTPDDDYKGVVWTLSAKGGDTYVRTRKSEQKSPEVRIDLRAAPGVEFEQNVRIAAQPFHRQSNGDGSGSGLLIVLDHDGRRVVRGRFQILNWLALTKAVGTERVA
jgi:uncharacterized protein (DUF58 family)